MAYVPGARPSSVRSRTDPAATTTSEPPGSGTVPSAPSTEMWTVAASSFGLTIRSAAVVAGSGNVPSSCVSVPPPGPDCGSMTSPGMTRFVPKSELVTTSMPAGVTPSSAEVCSEAVNGPVPENSWSAMRGSSGIMPSRRTVRDEPGARWSIEFAPRSSSPRDENADAATDTCVRPGLVTVSSRDDPTSDDPPTSHRVFVGHWHGLTAIPRRSPAVALCMEAPATIPPVTSSVPLSSGTPSAEVPATSGGSAPSKVRAPSRSPTGAKITSGEP